MLLHGGFNNRQTQPRAARLAIARFVGTVERTENLLAVFRTHARAVVIDNDGDPVFIHRECHLNLRMRVAQGVTHDILQRAFQRVGVTVQRPRARREVDGERFTHLFRFERRVVQHLVPQVIGFHRFAHQRVFLLIARHHQQIVNHAVQTVRFRFNTLQLFAFPAAATQQGGAQLQARERSAQLVGDVRQQALLGSHHPIQRAHHLVKTRPCGKELLRSSFQFRVLSQITLRHFIGGILQLTRRFRQAPRQP